MEVERWDILTEQYTCGLRSHAHNLLVEVRGVLVRVQLLHCRQQTGEECRVRQVFQERCRGNQQVYKA